jgi:hypothetical protein
VGEVMVVLAEPLRLELLEEPPWPSPAPDVGEVVVVLAEPLRLDLLEEPLLRSLRSSSLERSPCRLSGL